MLTRLEVRDLAVIEAAELEFGPGFTTLTGETGAGKSLLVDALGLVLGDRSSASLVRNGAKRASVSAEFDLPPESAARKTLASRELPEEDQLLLHRQIGSDGRSRAWANGVPVPLAVLRELGEALVEIHGQHEHLALAQTEQQRTLFDTWAECDGLAAEVREAARAVDLIEKQVGNGNVAAVLIAGLVRGPMGGALVLLASGAIGTPLGLLVARVKPRRAAVAPIMSDTDPSSLTLTPAAQKSALRFGWNLPLVKCVPHAMPTPRPGRGLTRLSAQPIASAAFSFSAGSGRPCSV